MPFTVIVGGCNWRNWYNDICDKCSPRSTCTSAQVDQRLQCSLFCH